MREKKGAAAPFTSAQHRAAPQLPLPYLQRGMLGPHPRRRVDLRIQHHLCAQDPRHHQNRRGVPNEANDATDARPCEPRTERLARQRRGSGRPLVKNMSNGARQCACAFALHARSAFVRFRGAGSGDGSLSVPRSVPPSSGASSPSSSASSNPPATARNPDNHVGTHFGGAEGASTPHATHKVAQARRVARVGGGFGAPVDGCVTTSCAPPSGRVVKPRGIWWQCRGPVARLVD